ncbi:MAG TPA: nuclear transport factor 2 family protein [Chthoniobacterales bacterium]|nr:nuclear transport factor 2 family protein [Chthoniobacterales bacterium]
MVTGQPVALFVRGFSYGVIVLSAMAVSLAASDHDDFIAREQAVWNAFKNKNADAVKKLVSTDVVAVYPDGMYNFQQRLDSMDKIEMKSFSLSDFNIVRPAAGVAVISYKAKVENEDGTLSELNCGTVWKIQNGEWKAVFHADMPAQSQK